MADLYASRGPVRLNDGTADANNAGVVNAAPTSTDYALEVRQVGLPAAAALADATTNPTLTALAAYNFGFNGTTWDRLRSTTANGLAVDVTRVTGTVTVDTELLAPAALADATGNPTITGISGYLMGFNGTTWDRVRTANTGRLQVDVITGGGGTPANILVDNAAFTDGTSSVGVVGYLFDEVAGTALTENDTAAARIDSKRSQVIVIEDATTRGQRMAVSAAGAISANLSAVGGTAIAIGQAAMAASLPVVIASNQSNLPVNLVQEGGVALSPTNPIDVRLSTGAAAYTLFGQTQAASPYTRISDGTTSVGVIVGTTALKADLSSVGGTAVVTGGVAGSQGIGGLAASGAAIAGQPVLIGGTFTTVQPTVTTGQAVNLQTSNRGAILIATGADTPAFNLSQVGGAAVALGLAANAASIPVVLSSGQFPAAAALADATGNPTLTAISASLMGFNGTTWDRVRTANTGRLQVDVVTGGGGGAASGLPSGYNLIGLYGTTAAVASGATQTAVVTVTPVSAKTFFVRTVKVMASGQTKWQVKFGATVLDTGFNSQTMLSQTVFYDPPLSGTGDGTTALTVDITNREASAMDVYAGLRGWVLA